jgi:hypothetical protein
MENTELILINTSDVLHILGKSGGRKNKKSSAYFPDGESNMDSVEDYDFSLS